MSQTIKAKLLIATAKNYVDARKFFVDKGMKFFYPQYDVPLFIELKQMPSVLISLTDIGKGTRRGEWALSDINSQGITLMCDLSEDGFGFVFIPQENVIAIHDVDEDKLRANQISMNGE